MTTSKIVNFVATFRHCLLVVFAGCFVFHYPFSVIPFSNYLLPNTLKFYFYKIGLHFFVYKIQNPECEVTDRLGTSHIAGFQVPDRSRKWLYNKVSY